MHSSIVLQTVAALACSASLASAGALPPRLESLAESLPLVDFGSFHTIPLHDAQAAALADQVFKDTSVGPSSRVQEADTSAVQAAATCTNPSVRIEWRSMKTSDRDAFVNAIKCLMGRPASGNFAPADNRYEDLVRVHQQFTANIHGNHKFLLWHRYFVYAFETLLRNECSFKGPMPWWDETLDAGKFAKSTIFTDAYFGSLPGPTNGRGTCITDGKFARTTLHVGPGSSNQEHCLARAVNEDLTAQVTKNYVDTCNSRSTYPDMAKCSEQGPHAYGHNGIGSVMADVSGSPGDPTFFLHHLFVDRNFRIWQNGASSRKTTISGCATSSSPCTPLTMSTNFHVGGLIPDVKTRDILDTMGGVLCYRYNY